jgi:hypothetical protein
MMMMMSLSLPQSRVNVGEINFHRYYIQKVNENELNIKKHEAKESLTKNHQMLIFNI